MYQAVLLTILLKSIGNTNYQYQYILQNVLPIPIYIIKGDMFVCLFVCLSVMIYVPYGRPNGWADQDQTWHTHSCPPRECFWQGQCQGHSRMLAGLTEVRNTRNAARKRHLANSAQTTYGRQRRLHLANDYETPSGRQVIARVTRRGAEQWARPEDW